MQFCQEIEFLIMLCRAIDPGEAQLTVVDNELDTCGDRVDCFRMLETDQGFQAMRMPPRASDDGRKV